MNKYDDLTERRISKIIHESVASKVKSSYRPLQPHAKAISLHEARNRTDFEELQGE